MYIYANYRIKLFGYWKTSLSFDAKRTYYRKNCRFRYVVRKTAYGSRCFYTYIQRINRRRNPRLGIF